MATLKDIAAEAGVSIMTVSNVINGNYGRVSEKNIQKIRELVKKYDYVPNLSARSLSSNTSRIIVIFLPKDNPLVNYFSNPYMGELFGEIEMLIREQDYFVLIRSLEEIGSIPTILKNWNADGAIILTHQTHSDMKSITHSSECPVVFIDSYHTEDFSALTVGINEYKGGYTAAKHLIYNGHKKIAFAGPFNESNDIVYNRYRGYRAALKEAGIEYSSSRIIKTNTTYEDGIRIGKAIANGSYDVSAVFATADILAIGIMEGSRLNGMIVPNDLSVVGFDNLQICSFVTPKLTTISQDVKQKAESAVNLLMRAIRDDSFRKSAINLDVELEERQSVRRLV
ncbi:LacI family transcriptional regulator [Clostridium sp. W14A]|uniref:LacI family DNA-binding transcriptional regulator n=1 Tax=Caproicibacter fermentans TaxID=2576756 RepID=A0A7G8T7C7_9FIRM|nr:LacI family DNA-binding transcriptional regulator [Caproicibacter fermentans]OCN01389.1 LacI family transcriptional regulator [Clostridium sp. W14A]QNK39518.1 LacI family DNA-binding transcriptional regulator [Caproicibacter fermentans]